MHCLLLHGLAGSPFEMQPLAEALTEAGFVAHTPALPGHASTAAAYLQSCWQDWLGLARAEFTRLAAQGPVLLAGYSLGGLLALSLAQEAASGAYPQPAGLLALATPLFFHKWHPFFCVSPFFYALPLTSRLCPTLRQPPRSAASRAMAPWQGHEEALSLRHFAQITRALPALRAGLPKLCLPLCIVQLRSDTSAHPYNAHYLAKHAGSASVELHLLQVQSPHGGHLPVTHAESRERVAALAVSFARRVAP